MLAHLGAVHKRRPHSGGEGGNRFADICGQGGRGGFWNVDVHISTFSATENRRLFYSVFGFPGQCEPRIKRTVM